MEKTVNRNWINNLKIGDRIYATTPNWVGDNKDHINRSFIVVGNDPVNKKVYTLYTTSSDKGEKYNELYHKMKYSDYKDRCNYYVQINRLIEIDYENIIDKNHTITHENEMLEIRNKLSAHIIDLNKIDYVTLVNVRTPGCIFVCDDEFCLIVKIENNMAYYHKLIKSNTGKIMLNGDFYELSFDNLYKMPAKKVKNRVKNINRKEFFDLINNKYSFGDIVNYNNSKIIIISVNNENIYYCDYDSLSMFLGIKKMPLNSINDRVIDKLNIDDQKKLANKINNYLKRSKFVDDSVSYSVRNTIERMI